MNKFSRVYQPMRHARFLTTTSGISAGISAWNTSRVSTSASMTSLVSKIEEYYPAIDSLDMQKVLGLFASNASYKRADKQYVGKENITKFFTEERQIRGIHDFTVVAAVPETNTIVVTGQFRGQGAKGDPRAVEFADFWNFNTNGLVTRRETYLALGHVYVQR